MRLALVRKVGLSILALGIFGIGGCDNNPIDYDAKKTVGIQLVPTTMVVSAGRSEQLQVTAMNQGFEPTGTADVAFTIFSCGVGGATVVVVPDSAQQLPILPPQSRWLLQATNTIGQTCIEWTSQGIADTMLVTVVPEGLSIETAPQLLRSGQSSTITLVLISNDTLPIGILDPTDLTWSSSDNGILPVDASGNIGPAGVTGTATITATWVGTEESASAGLGVSRSIDVIVPVIADVPATAQFDPALAVGGAFGAYPSGSTINVEVQALDQFGNQNQIATEVTAVTITSSNVAAVTATVTYETDADDPLVASMPAVLATLAAGPAVVSGVVTTSAGALPYTGTITVLAPMVAGLSVDNGDYGTTVTISGSGFVALGFATTVIVGGEQLGNFTVNSDASITAQMPTYAAAGGAGAGALAPETVAVDVGGVVSNSALWTQNNVCNANDFVPGNNAPGGSQAVSLPLSCPGTFTGDLVLTKQWFVMTVSPDALAGNATADWFFTASWTPNKDLDVIWCEPDLTCHFGIDPSGDSHNEDITDGDWYIYMDDFAADANGDTTPATYLLDSTLN